MKRFSKSLLVLTVLLLISMSTFAIGLATNQISDSSIPAWLHIFLQPPLIWVTIGGLILLVAMGGWAYHQLTAETTASHATIKAKNLKSRKGGLKIENQTGHGTEVENVEVETDISLKSQDASSPKTKRPA